MFIFKNIAKKTEEDAAKPTFSEDQGILSQLMAEEEGVAHPEEEIVSFSNNSAPDLGSDRKDEIATDYGLGNLDLDAFKIKIQQRGDINTDLHEPHDSIKSNLQMFGLDPEEGKI